MELPADPREELIVEATRAMLRVVIGVPDGIDKLREELATMEETLFDVGLTAAAVRPYTH